MIKIFMIFILFFNIAFAESECTHYVVQGKMVASLNSPLKSKITVYSKSNSEITLLFNQKRDFSTLAPFFEQEVKFEVDVKNWKDARIGIIENITNVRVAMPNALNMNGHFKKMGKCK